jgi:hypothetical protein
MPGGDAAGPPTETLRDKLILALFEKGLLVLVLGLLAWFGQQLLESYRAKEALHTEITHERVEKVGEVTAALGAAELALVRLDDAAQQLPSPSAQDLATYRERRATAQSSVDNLVTVFHRDRFWLGPAALCLIKGNIATISAQLHSASMNVEQLATQLPDVEKIERCLVSQKQCSCVSPFTPAAVR